MLIHSLLAQSLHEQVVEVFCRLEVVGDLSRSVLLLFDQQVRLGRLVPELLLCAGRGVVRTILNPRRAPKTCRAQTPLLAPGPSSGETAG